MNSCYATIALLQFTTLLALCQADVDLKNIKISTVLLGEDTKLEIICITDHEEYCWDKLRGFRFKDGCRSCQCWAGRASCETKNCIHFVDLEVIPEVYCKELLQQNLNNLNIVAGRVNPRHVSPTRKWGSRHRLFESEQMEPYTEKNVEIHTHPNFVETSDKTTEETDQMINESRLKSSLSDLKFSQSNISIKLQLPVPHNESAAQLTIASSFQKQNGTEGEDKQDHKILSLKESALHANVKHENKGKSLQHQSAQPQERLKIKHQDSSEKSLLQKSEYYRPSKNEQNHFNAPITPRENKILSSPSKVLIPYVKDIEAIDKTKNMPLGRSSRREGNRLKDKFLNFEKTNDQPHKVEKHPPDQAGPPAKKTGVEKLVQQPGNGQKEHSTALNMVRKYFSELFSNQKPRNTKIPDESGKEQGKAFLTKIANVISKFLNEKYSDQPPKQYLTKDRSHHKGHGHGNYGTKRGNINIRFFTAYGDISADSLDDISRELLPKLAKGIQMQVKNGSTLDKNSVVTQLEKPFPKTRSLKVLEGNGQTLFIPSESFLIQARILRPNKGRTPNNLIQNSGLVLSESPRRVIRFHSTPEDTFESDIDSVNELDMAYTAVKPPVQSTRANKYPISVHNKMKMKLLLKQIVELLRAINTVTNRLKRCRGYRRLMRTALSDLAQ